MNFIPYVGLVDSNLDLNSTDLKRDEAYTQLKLTQDSYKIFIIELL